MSDKINSINFYNNENDKENEIISNLKITDNILFSSILENTNISKKFIELVLDIKIKDIKFVSREKSLDSIGFSRGVRFDVFIDSYDAIYNIEIQTSNTYDIPKRMRYYQDRIDRDILRKGVKSFNELKPTYIIFICLYNPFKYKSVSNRWIYKFENVDISNNEVVFLDDESYKIFINTECDLDIIHNNDIKALISLLKNGYISQIDSNLTDLMIKEANMLKNDEIWRYKYMELLEERVQYGKLLGIMEIAKNMIICGYDDDEILRLTNLTQYKLDEIKKEILE